MSLTKNALDIDDFYMDRAEMLRWTALTDEAVDSLVAADLLPAPVVSDVWYSPDIYNWIASRSPATQGPKTDSLGNNFPF